MKSETSRNVALPAPDPPGPASAHGARRGNGGSIRAAARRFAVSPAAAIKEPMHSNDSSAGRSVLCCGHGTDGLSAVFG
jgi:hypothetical protein